MGLDVGEKTIGIAISDPFGITAQGLETLKRYSKKADLARLRDLVDEYGVEKIIVGLPLNMDGTIGPAASKIEQFSIELGKKLGVPVQTWDERLSTAAAERALLQADLSRGKRKKIIDKLAAVLILESYLRRQQNNK
ncbi:MAG: Holliday junction resolvase RuvX [Firmicutes bacterium]|nr:Holliday junction resolvase RuvX [Bacillota bacterium]